MIASENEEVLLKMNTKSMDTGNKLRNLRHQFECSQQQVAEALGVSKSTYCRMESNNARINMEQLEKIFNYYSITANDFFEMTFPICHFCRIPKELLDNLERVLKENENIVGDWNENRERFNHLREAFEPVFEERAKAFDFPELDVSNIESGTNVKEVRLDLRAEKLIDRYFEIQKKYCDILFGGVSIE